MEKTANDDRINPGILALAIFASVLWTDAATKLWAQEALTEPVHITSWLCLALQRNTAIFFGAVPVSEVSVALWLFLGTALVGLGWRMVRTDSLAIGAGYALVTGGVLGNALGRANGAVVDFLGFGPVVGDQWAFANVADVAMLGGMLILGAVLVRGRAPAPRPQSA